MKQPKLNNLTIDRVGTRQLRTQLKKSKKIKITINFDAASLRFVRKIDGKTSPPYHQLISQLLKENLDDNALSRLDRIERELKKLKRQIAA